MGSVPIAQEEYVRRHVAAIIQLPLRVAGPRGEDWREVGRERGRVRRRTRPNRDTADFPKKAAAPPHQVVGSLVIPSNEEGGHGGDELPRVVLVEGVERAVLWGAGLHGRSQGGKTGAAVRGKGERGRGGDWKARGATRASRLCVQPDGPWAGHEGRGRGAAGPARWAPGPPRGRSPGIRDRRRSSQTGSRRSRRASRPGAARGGEATRNGGR